MNINDLKSNNSEDMRNKQIAEMARDLHITNDCAEYFMNVLGYRKQSVGEWIEHSEIGAMNNAWECSVCHWKTVSFTEMKHSKFCPNCGAHMRGGKNE